MNEMVAPELLSEALDKGVLTLTLGSGPAHPLSLAMIRELQGALDRAADNPEARVIVIHGPGRIFCAGHDLKEIARCRTQPDQGRAFLTELFNACAEMMMAITRSPRPTIAMVEGLATAAGCQIVAACDLAFASDAATFALPGVNNGGFCTTPAVAVARCISRKHVMEMTLSGETYAADWARDAGLVNRVLPADQLAEVTSDFACKLATRHAPAVELGKQTLNRQMEMLLEAAYEVATKTMITHFMDSHRIAHERETWGQK